MVFGRSARLLVTGLFLATLALAPRADAILVPFEATLLGVNEVPPNASPGTGFGTVILDTLASTITVDESWTGLTAPATASHIHAPAPPGTNAPVIFPFSGVPAATSGSIPTQVFAITPTQIVQLNSGLMYMNVHNANFPGGEVRGQLLPTPTPEPGTLSLMGTGIVGLVGWRRRKQAR